MEYLLYVFAKHDKQEKFVTFLSEEIFIMTNDNDIRYYYGPESVIFKFKSNEKTEDIGDYLNNVLGCSGIVFFLQPYEKGKLYYWVDSTVNKHLFGIETIDEMTEQDRKEFQSYIFKNLELNEEDDINEHDEDFLNIKELLNTDATPCKKIDLTLDELLDKINDKGIESLTKKEKELLNNYSK
jgi:hypothetical protein